MIKKIFSKDTVIVVLLLFCFIKPVAAYMNSDTQLNVSQIQLNLMMVADHLDKTINSARDRFEKNEARITALEKEVATLKSSRQK